MVQIVTDSTSDLSREEQEQLRVRVIPLTVHFEDGSYQDGVDLSHEEFYEKLAVAEKLPTTSQVNPETFAALFQSYVDAGDEVVALFISGELSGTCQSARIAAQMVDPERVHVLDSRNVTFALGLLVRQAAQLRDEGKTAGEIVSQIEELIGRVRLVAVVDTLKYLKMGGRLSTASAVVGGILGINPIIALEGGRVEAIGKVRGRKAAFEFMAKFLAQHPVDPAYPVAFGHSNAPALLEECRSYFTPLIGTDRLVSGGIGCIVGTHAGPGATGFAYVEAAR